MAIPYLAVAAGLKGAELIGNAFRKSDKEIRQEQGREYLKRRAQMRDLALRNLQEETGKNIGRINQFTTGSIKRMQGDIGARAASRGRNIDEADILAGSGIITGQGSENIQSTIDSSERARKALEEQYQQDVLNAEMEGITYPESPGITDVLGSLAEPALRYGFNQQYLDKAFPAGNTSITAGPRTQIPADFSVEGELPDTIPTRTDRTYDVTKPGYNFMEGANGEFSGTPFTLFPKRQRRFLSDSYYPQVVR